jgi:signal transduction histidine kinase
MKGLLALIDVPLENPDEQRRARLLNIMLVGFTLLTLIAIVLVSGLIVARVPGWQDLTSALVSMLLFLVGIAVVFSLNRTGRVMLSSIVFIFILIVALTFANVAAMGRGDTLFYFVIPVLIASFLIRPYAGFVVAGVTSIVFIAMAILLNLEPEFFIGTISMLAIALIAWLAARNLESTLLEVRIINQELDQRVIARTRELAGVNLRLEDQARELAQANLQLERQARELFDANERLKSLDRLKSKFVSDVTHELRTPVSNLTIYLEMLEHGNPEKKDRYMAVLQEETDRLSQLVTDVLNLSRMEMGTTRVEFAWIDLNQVATEVVLANQLRAEARGFEIIFEPTKGLPLVWGDRNQLKMAISNLVGNAINYTSNGWIKVGTYLDHKQDRVILFVQDTGMGIDQDDIPHVFDRFYRGQQASQSTIPGTGLGLSITKEILNLHYGGVDVKSELGKGSTFTVHIPLRGDDLLEDST